MQWLPKKNANLLNSNEMGKVAIRMNGFFTVSASVGRMSQLGQKRKLTTKSITEKYIILKEVDKGNSCASVAMKHNIPKQTLSNWLKKKKQIYESVDSNSTRKKRQRFRGSPYENIDEACYKWLVNASGRSIPISATVLKTKALYFAKEFGCNDFSASDGWLDRWKKRKNVSFTTISGLFTYIHGFSVHEIKYLQILTVL